MLVARAPSRIDLAGGTVDLWPLYLLIPEAATVNLAIDLETEVGAVRSADRLWRVRERISGKELSAESPEELLRLEGAEIAGHLLRFFRPPEPLTLTSHSEAPPQAGLGASSSLGIAIAGLLDAVTGLGLKNLELISLVKDVEVELLGTMTGAQDHYPPVFGGAMCLWWRKLAHRREALEIDPNAFESRFVLAYSHQPHRSGATNWEVVRRFLDGDPATRKALEKSGRTAVRVRDALVERDLDRVVELVGEDWDARREMAPGVSSPELEILIRAAREAGAVSAKVCGAGGGGCIILGVGAERRPKVEAAVVEAGGSILPYHLAKRGLRLLTDAP